MADLLNNEIINRINELFRQAEEQEQNYNWDKEIKILKKAKQICLNNVGKEIEGDVYYKLGEIYQIAADYQKTKNEVLNCFQLSISHFERALESFKELKIIEKVNAALGSINLLKYISGFEEGKEESLLNSAKNYFHKAKLLFIQKRNKIDSLKMAILESRALTLLIGEKSIRIDEHANFNVLSSESRALAKDITDGIINQSKFSEIYAYYFFISLTEFCIWTVFCLPIEDSIRTQYILDFIDLSKKFIDTTKNAKNTLFLFSSYTVYSFLNTVFGVFTKIDQFEQKKYMKIAEHWLKKGDPLLENPHHPIPNTALTLFYFMRFANAILLIALGFSARDFKHIMENIDFFSKLFPIHFPRLTITSAIIYNILILSLGAVNLSAPDVTRIDFAKRALDLDELTNTISIANNPDYKTYKLVRLIFSGFAYAVLADLVKDKSERSKYFQIAAKIFDDITKYNFQELDKTQIYTFYLNHTSRTAMFLAKNAPTQSEKIDYYENAIDMLIKSRFGGFYQFYMENLFYIGDIFQKLAILKNDDKIFEKSRAAYFDAIDFCKDRGYFNLVGSGYVNISQIEDRLGNFHSAARNYKKAIESFKKAILTLTYTKLRKKIGRLKNYMKAWNLIELAKTYHIKEDHLKAQENYEQASEILKNIREYKFEAPLYSAWGMLEKAEYLSKQNKHEEAAATYLVTKNNFQVAEEFLNSYLDKRKSPEDIERILKLIEVTKVRKTYCSARHNIETARLESKKGVHLTAAELYNKASTLFEKLCETFGIKREKDELTAIFYLCKAWENMERAEIEQKPSIYNLASELFEKAGNIFPESRMKKLSLGNSFYCNALSNSLKFDRTANLREKMEYYRKIKMHLRDSSKNYQLGGFKQDAQWALATSAFFDGMWHLIQSDYEVDHTKKNQFLNIATNYLNNALNIFGKAGYKKKREEILEYLKMIRDEKAILASALGLIEKPAISVSSIGISAPSCPIEISSSVNIEEMQRTDLQTESEMNWQKRIHEIYLFMPKNGICIYDHSFKINEDIEGQLISGGLTGISMLIQEVTKSKTKVKIVEQEEITILFEHGKYLSAALITEENLVTLRNKLKKIIQDIEDFYQEELETYSGNIEIFSKIGIFIERTFEKRDK